MKRSRLRFAVLMDYAFSTFQEEPRLGIARYLGEAGIDAVYFGIGKCNPQDPEDHAMAGFLDLIGPDEFDGIIVVSMSLINSGGKDILAERLSRLKPMPMVSIGPPIIGEDSVLYDSECGMKSIMDHLINDHGYRRFAFVSGPLSNADSLARRETFRAALDEAGIPHGEEMEYVGNFLPPSGYDAVSAFLDERALKCEAIVCANDLMAIGVWNAIIKRGMNVPFDIAVTGYDDSQLSHALSNQFTTVRQSFDRLGYLAAKRLHALTRGETLGPFEPLATELRIRSSCGCVEFEKRPNTLAEKNDRVLSERMRENIVDFVRRESPASESAGIYRLWTNTVLGMLREHRPVYELEEMLRETRKSLFDNGISNWDNSLLLNLYALMLDACGQTVFVKFWRDAVFSTDLRVILDRIQDSLTKNVSLSAHYGMFKGITDHCNAKEFHIARFADFSNPDAGASAVYTTTPDWKPGPGSWFPGEGHSIVANMIANADYRYGYFLLDADVPVTSTFDYLRIRFSNVSKDLLNLKSIYELNAELVRQVAEREEAELRLKDALTMVEQLSVEDELTGLRNRRGFYALAEQQIKYLRREKSSFFVVYADLDGLKAINDKWGHQDGDLAIRAAAEALKGALRDSDIVARMGGDEFTALVNKSEPPNYEIIKRRILEACEQKTRELAKPWSLSISIGHYHSHADCALSLREMLELADANLYGVKQKKKAGRKG